MPDEAEPAVVVDVVSVVVELPLEETEPPVDVDPCRVVVELLAEAVLEAPDVVAVVVVGLLTVAAVGVDWDEVLTEDVAEMGVDWDEVLPDDVAAPMDRGRLCWVVEALLPHPASSRATPTVVSPVNLRLVIANGHAARLYAAGYPVGGRG